jgi:hypothetical protein
MTGQSQTPEWFDRSQGNFTEDAGDSGERGGFVKILLRVLPLLRALGDLNDRAAARTYDEKHYQPEVQVT